MGPPKDTSPPFLFGKDFQPNLLVNEENHSNSAVNEEDDDEYTHQNVLLSSKLFENPPIPIRGERFANILQSSSLPLVSPPATMREVISTLSAKFLEEQPDTKSEDDDNNNNLQIPLLKEKLFNQIQHDELRSVENNASHSLFNKDINRFESPNPTAETSPLQGKLFESPEVTNDAGSDEYAIPKGFENLHTTKETSSSNDSQRHSEETREAKNVSVEIPKKNLQSSLPKTSIFGNIPANSNEKKALHISSVESNVANPPVPQNSDTKSNYFEEREEQCFFDRAKFIAICGEGFFDQAQEPWPQDVKLYQPYEVEQVILPDNANCLAVQAYLKMCGLDFQTEQRHNAEYMSPSGRVPFIKCGAFVVSELDPIIAFINTKGVSLTGQLDAGQRADMRAYMSLANTVLANAELYVAWVDTTTANAVTRPRYGSVHPWPLNHIVTWQKARQVRKRLAVLGWLQKSVQEVYAEVENCCNALSERLDKKDFFFGSRPTELDALVFGHLFTVLTTPLPSNRLASIVRGYPALVELVKRVEKQFFQREN